VVEAERPVVQPVLTHQREREIACGVKVHVRRSAVS
jgi:hypothetical protein